MEIRKFSVKFLQHILLFYTNIEKYMYVVSFVATISIVTQHLKQEDLRDNPNNKKQPSKTVSSDWAKSHAIGSCWSVSAWDLL